MKKVWAIEGVTERGYTWYWCDSQRKPGFHAWNVGGGNALKLTRKEAEDEVLLARGPKGIDLDVKIVRHRDCPVTPEERQEDRRAIEACIKAEMVTPPGILDAQTWFKLLLALQETSRIDFDGDADMFQMAVTFLRENSEWIEVFGKAA